MNRYENTNVIYSHNDNYHSNWYPSRVNPITDTIN